VFSGRFDHAIDDKGRVSIPARFRELLQREGHDRLFITNFYYSGERCLEVYPPAEWEKFVAQISSKNRFDSVVQKFEAFYIGGAYEVPVDRQGRVLVPPKQREWAGLVREVTFSALRDHFQLWDKAVLERVLRATEEELQDPGFYAKLNF
jgi:transcriptional regulator MraZ